MVQGTGSLLPRTVSTRSHRDNRSPLGVDADSFCALLKAISPGGQPYTLGETPAVRHHGRSLEVNAMDQSAHSARSMFPTAPDVLSLPNWRVSIAIPVHNEEAVLPELLRRLTVVLDSLPGGTHEIVFVDDGSLDSSRQILCEAARTDHRITVATLSRNFGHQAALTAALDVVGGDVVVVMDADLQDSPEDVATLLAAVAAGSDVAYAIRTNRKEGWLLRVCYAVAYRIIASLSNTKLPVDAGDFAAMTRRVVDEIRHAPEHNRYLRGLRSWVGFRQTAVPVARGLRFAGDSKYSIRALARLALDGVFAFSTMPLRVATVVGLLAIGASALFAVYAVYARVVYERVPEGFTSLLVMMVFLAGANLLFMGIMGEYIGRIYEEAKARPLYVIDEIISQGERRPSRSRSA